LHCNVSTIGCHAGGFKIGFGIATTKAVRTFLIPETVRLNFGKLSYRADSELVELHGEALDLALFFP